MGSEKELAEKKGNKINKVLEEKAAKELEKEHFQEKAKEKISRMVK